MSAMPEIEEEHTSEAGEENSEAPDEDNSVTSSRLSQEHVEAAERDAAVKAAVQGSGFPLSRVSGDGTLQTARAPAPLSLPRDSDTSARNMRTSPGGGGGTSSNYQDFMRSQQILSDDFRAPSEASASADWPDEISNITSSPAGSRAGSNAGGATRRHRGSGSSAGGSSVGSHGHREDDFGLNIMELDLGDDDLNLDDFSDRGGIEEEQSDFDPDEGPLGPAASSNIDSMGRVHSSTRVADGVGLSRDGHNGLQRVAPPTGRNEATTSNGHQNYEFTNMKDARSQLRFMLTKHQPGGRMSPKGTNRQLAVDELRL
jgi:hypothetical protein